MRETSRGGGEEDDGDVGEEVKFGESERGGQKGNSGSGGDGGSGDKDNYEECKDGKFDYDEAAVYSFLGNIVEGYYHRDPENSQNNISRLNKEILLHSKLDTELSDTQKELTETRKRDLETRYFLDGLPKRLGDVEKASLLLPDFFKTQPGGG